MTGHGGPVAQRSACGSIARYRVVVLPIYLGNDATERSDSDVVGVREAGIHSGKPKGTRIETATCVRDIPAALYPVFIGAGAVVAGSVGAAIVEDEPVVHAKAEAVLAFGP